LSERKQQQQQQQRNLEKFYAVVFKREGGGVKGAYAQMITARLGRHF